MDEEKPDVFSVSVGNLPPKCDAIIKIIYVTELDVCRTALKRIFLSNLTLKDRLMARASFSVCPPMFLRNKSELLHLASPNLRPIQ